MMIKPYWAGRDSAWLITSLAGQTFGEISAAASDSILRPLLMKTYL
jgi:hypothetical protein